MNSSDIVFFARYYAWFFCFFHRIDSRCSSTATIQSDIQFILCCLGRSQSRGKGQYVYSKLKSISFG